MAVERASVRERRFILNECGLLGTVTTVLRILRYVRGLAEMRMVTRSGTREESIEESIEIGVGDAL